MKLLRREIVRVDYYRGMNHPRNARSAHIHFNCGHVRHCKGSEVPKNGWAYCSECQKLLENDDDR